MITEASLRVMLELALAAPLLVLLLKARRASTPRPVKVRSRARRP
jgi:hypothetical protein